MRIQTLLFLAYWFFFSLALQQSLTVFCSFLENLSSSIHFLYFLCCRIEVTKDFCALQIQCIVSLNLLIKVCKGKVTNIFNQEELVDFESPYKLLNSLPSCPDYLACPHNRKGVYSLYLGFNFPRNEDNVFLQNSP